MRRSLLISSLIVVASGCAAQAGTGEFDKAAEEQCLPIEALSNESILRAPPSWNDGERPPDEAQLMAWTRDYGAVAKKLCATDRPLRCGWMEQLRDTLPTPPASSTDRARWLTYYANYELASRECKVEVELSRRADATVRRASPLVDYFIDVRGERDACFSDRGRGTWQPNFNLDDDELESMKLQLTYLSSFMADFHQSSDGAKTLLFDQIHVCPDTMDRPPFFLEDGVLLLGVDWANWFDIWLTDGGFGWSLGDVVEPTALRDVWRSGEHIPESDEQLKKFWFFVNPTGLVRRAIRRTVGLIANVFSGMLQNIANGDPAQMSVSMEGLIRKLFQNEEVGSFPISSEALVTLREMPPQEMYERIESIDEFIQNPDNWDGVAQAVIVAPMIRSKYDIDIEQINCGVAHGNFHNINVDVLGHFFSGAQRFMHQVSVHEVEHKIRVRQTGRAPREPTEGEEQEPEERALHAEVNGDLALLLNFLGLPDLEVDIDADSVCTYSIDDVGVGLRLAQVDYRGALERAAIEQAFGDLGLSAAEPGQPVVDE